MTRLAPWFALFLVLSGVSGLVVADGKGGRLLHDPKLHLAVLAAEKDSDGRLFTNYNPNGPCQWNQGWPWKLDLSGVAWDVATAVTAITPRHVVMADHFQRRVGERVVFHDRKGRWHERHILKVMSLKELGLPGDIAVGLLDSALPDSIRTYPLPEPRDDYAALLPGATVLLTEQGRSLFFHQVAGIGGASVAFRFDERFAESRHKNLIVGDSGHPSFVLSHGELVLIETHTTGGPGAGPFYGSPEVVKVLRKIVATLDPAYSLKTVAMDGPVLEDAKNGLASMPKPPPPPASPPKPADPPQQAVPRQPRPRVVPPP